MSSLAEKVASTLNETRIVILGAQLLLGIQFNAAFSVRFGTIPGHLRALDALALGLIMMVVVLLIGNVPYHQIAESGEATPGILDFGTRTIERALLPFALALGLDLEIAIELVEGPFVAIGLGVGLFLLALGFWYGLPMLAGRWFRPLKESVEMPEPLPLDKKIDDLLTEARIILPGVQALFGFQFGAILTNSFEQLPPMAKLVHEVSLSFVAIAVILLMAPAAFHRIATGGEYTGAVYRYGTRMVLTSLVPLALGLAGDFYVTIIKIFDSALLAAALAGLVLTGALVLWFAYPLWSRRANSRSNTQQYR